MLFANSVFNASARDSLGIKWTMHMMPAEKPAFDADAQKLNCIQCTMRLDASLHCIKFAMHIMRRSRCDIVVKFTKHGSHGDARGR